MHALVAINLGEDTVNKKNHRRLNAVVINKINEIAQHKKKFPILDKPYHSKLAQTRSHGVIALLNDDMNRSND